MAISNTDVLVSGKTSFKIEVPYKLIETGTKKNKKPLIIYLHGYGQNISSFKKICNQILSIEAYHLFIQGPYPIYDRTRKKNVSDWGCAWYLYDGNPGQFIKSLELTSEFIQEVVDNLLKFINVNRLCILGYSMGGYLAGYFSLTRWKHVNDLVVAGGRIKTEILNDEWANIRHLNVLAVHGNSDKNVKPGPQEKEIRAMKENGINAELILLNESHSFTEVYIAEIYKWLVSHQYKEAKK
ncbi:MAG: dienelactone hydrolase family protein [Balneolaceae bacterium]